MRKQKTLEHLYKEIQKAESLVIKTVKEATTLWMAYCTEQDIFIATRILKSWEICMVKKRLLHQDHMAKLTEFAVLSSTLSTDVNTIPNTKDTDDSTTGKVGHSNYGYGLATA